MPSSPALSNSPASSAPVDTSKVSGRRTLRYESFDDLLADAERMASVPTQTLGNWSPGQIFKHLALSFDSMLDGPPFMMPLPVRWFLTLLYKQRFITRSLDPGFKIPKSGARMVPKETPTAEGLALLRAAVARVKATKERALHGGFGKLTQPEWDAFQLRHCEMHMSFIVPAE